jgi:heme/copper-type cytochrome/quinol oxidase subunit 3
MASDFAHPATEYEVVEAEAPEVLARNLVTAGHLLASATAFFFLAFVFAYFYLRSINNHDMWRPKHIDPSVPWGTAIVACLVLSAIVLRLGLADHRADRRDQWRWKGIVAFLLGFLALVLQVVAWTELGFGPADGGYASVYVGWTAFYFLFVLMGLYWLETVLATSWRYRGWASGTATVAPGEASGDPHREADDIRDPVSLVRAELGSLSFYWTFLVGIGVLTWVVLYLI